MDLAERAAAAKECDHASSCRSGQGLEQVPGRVVEEEDALEGNQRAEEEGMGKGSVLERGGKVVDIGAEQEPLNKHVS